MRDIAIPRLERLSNRHTIKWDDDEGETVCGVEDFTARVWLDAGRWQYQVTQHGMVRDSGNDKTERQAQISCERWIRSHFNENIERTFR